MSTPLTLCLAVLARHVDRLQFIDIMLGDQPALTPQQAAYQRMLTGDPVEAATTAIENDKASSICLCYLEDVSKARLDYAVQKLSRRVPAARIVVSLLADSPRVSSDTPPDNAHPRSLKATIALFADPPAGPEACQGTNGINESSG